ncbi:hypothetical protein RIF29_09320 [Crotalaria pallida]|uniref:Uncharacterized protein n=1 Tax=Crotalaria pallida TaxID=3830 RepID=A0AAN9FUK2_CROPI
MTIVHGFACPFGGLVSMVAHGVAEAMTKGNVVIVATMVVCGIRMYIPDDVAVVSGSVSSKPSVEKGLKWLGWKGGDVEHRVYNMPVLVVEWKHRVDNMVVLVVSSEVEEFVDARCGCWLEEKEDLPFF